MNHEPCYQPGDFIRSRLARHWTAIIVEYRPVARGEVPGYVVRRWDGVLDWIGEDDILRAAPALDAETLAWLDALNRAEDNDEQR